jgi:hypothetical protein
MKAAILFYSLLDEQQRRLYAGLESIKLGPAGVRARAPGVIRGGGADRAQDA